MTPEEKVSRMYSEGATNDQVAEYLFGPQWAMAATPKDGWILADFGWTKASKKKIGGFDWVEITIINYLYPPLSLGSE